MKTIKILGAGPAGLTAAINLAKEGYGVEVFEKNSDVGKRFHGDIQGIENWSERKEVLKELREMNIDINFDCDPISSIELTNCNKTKNINTKKPFTYLLKRGSTKGTLDFGLKEQAIAAGAKINFNSTIDQDDSDIIATGPIFKRVPGVDKSIVFKTDYKDTAIMILNDELAYKGYSYLLITKGHGCLATVVVDDTKKVNECYKKTIDYVKQTFNLDMQIVQEAGGVGSFMMAPTFTKNGKLYCGEAAVLQDILWGFGIRTAIDSGFLAAKSIIENKDYSKMAEKRFLKKMKATIVDRYIWEKMSKSNYKNIINHGQFIVNHLFNLHNFPMWQRLLYPIALRHFKEKYPKCVADI